MENLAINDQLDKAFSKIKMKKKKCKYMEKTFKDITFYENFKPIFNEIETKENKIEFPKFKPLNLSLQSNLKTDSAVSKRIQIFNQDDMTSQSIQDWLDKLEINQLTNIPNELIREAAKEKNIKIKVNKNEQNKVMKS